MHTKILFLDNKFSPMTSTRKRKKDIKINWTSKSPKRGCWFYCCLPFYFNHLDSAHFIDVLACAFNSKLNFRSWSCSIQSAIFYDAEKIRLNAFHFSRFFSINLPTKEKRKIFCKTTWTCRFFCIKKKSAARESVSLSFEGSKKKNRVFECSISVNFIIGSRRRDNRGKLVTYRKCTLCVCLSTKTCGRSTRVDKKQEELSWLKITNFNYFLKTLNRSRNQQGHCGCENEKLKSLRFYVILFC